MMSQGSKRKISFHSNLNNSPEKSMSDVVGSEIIDSFFPSAREGFYKHEDKERLQMTEKDAELYNKILGRNFLQENRMIKNLLSLPSTTALRSKTQSAFSQSQRSPLKESPTKDKKEKVQNILDRSQHKKLLTHLNMFLAQQNNDKKLNSLKRRKSCGCSLCGGICSKDFLLDEIHFEKIDQEKEVPDPRTAFQKGRRIMKSKTLFSMRSIDLRRGGLNFQGDEIETRKRVSSLPVIKREMKRTMSVGEVRQSALSARSRFSQRSSRRLTIVKETESTPMSQMGLISEGSLDFPLIMLPDEDRKEISSRRHRDPKTLLIRKKSFDICHKITAAPLHLGFDYNRNQNTEETEKISRIAISKRSKTPSSTTRFPSIISLKTEPAEFESDQIVPLKTLLITCQTDRGHSKIEDFRRKLKINTGATPLSLSPQKRLTAPLKPLRSSKSVERAETTNLRKTSNSFGRLSTQENTERNNYEDIYKVYNKTLLYRKSLI